MYWHIIRHRAVGTSCVPDLLSSSLNPQLLVLWLILERFYRANPPSLPQLSGLVALPFWHKNAIQKSIIFSLIFEIDFDASWGASSALKSTQNRIKIDPKNNLFSNDILEGQKYQTWLILRPPTSLKYCKYAYENEILIFPQNCNFKRFGSILKSILGGFGRPKSTLLASQIRSKKWSIFRSILCRFWCHLGAQLGSQNPPKIVPKSSQIASLGQLGAQEGPGGSQTPPRGPRRPIVDDFS